MLKFYIACGIALGLSTTQPMEIFAASDGDVLGYDAVYQVYQNQKHLQNFDSYESALQFAKQWNNALIVYDGVIWKNGTVETITPQTEYTYSKTEPFFVYQNDKLILQSETYTQAYEYAKQYANSYIMGDIVIWDNYPPFYYFSENTKVWCNSILEYISTNQKYDSMLYDTKTQSPIQSFYDSAIQYTYYDVYQNDIFLEKFSTYEQALYFAKNWSHATIIQTGMIWNQRQPHTLSQKSYSTWNQTPVYVFQNNTFLQSFDTPQSAYEYAKQYANSYIIGEMVVWDNYEHYYYIQADAKILCEDIPSYIAAYKNNTNISHLYDVHTNEIKYQKLYTCNHIISNVPTLAQNPELPRGCEVTSLAMMLQYHGIHVSKMTLAEQIVKIPYKEDPNKGFIGDMYHLWTFGLGVYHTPIKNLAEQYVDSDRVLDLTGCEFEDLYYYIQNDFPIWVIANTRFHYLGESYFTYWDTPSGTIKITYQEHSVLITGIDENYVYLNDPLTGGSRKVNKQNFIACWEQMGKQCIVIV